MVTLVLGNREIAVGWCKSGLALIFSHRVRKELVFCIWSCYAIWGFPKIRGTILGVRIIRIIIYWGLYWGPLILGNYHISA